MLSAIIVSVVSVGVWVGVVRLVIRIERTNREREIYYYG